MKNIRILIALLPLTIIVTSCVKHDEIDFAGTIVGVRGCAASALDQNMGYIVSLDYPEGAGSTYVTGDDTLHNAIVLFEPTRRIYVEDHISGTFYLDEKYSRANCSVIVDGLDLPEGVFTDINVD